MEGEVVPIPRPGWAARCWPDGPGIGSEELRGAWRPSGPRKKLARTRSTGSEPRRAIREADPRDRCPVQDCPFHPASSTITREPAEHVGYFRASTSETMAPTEPAFVSSEKIGALLRPDTPASGVLEGDMAVRESEGLQRRGLRGRLRRSSCWCHGGDGAAGLGFGAGTDADTDGLADVVGVAEAEALGVGIASVEATVTAGAGLELTEPKLAATRRPAVTAAAPSNNTCNLRLATPAVVQGGHTRTREAVAVERGPGQDSVQGLFPDPAPPLDR